MRSTQKQTLKSEYAMSTWSAVAVIPAYNEAKTIAGIVGRTARVIERVIVVDDGSTVPASELVKTFEVVPPFKLRSVRQANAGPASARNSW